MRNGQNKRMRGRNNHRKSHNPMVRVFESNGPDVKIRGNPSHIAEKYIQLARDAQASGDPIAAENYYQHAEHYYRVIASAQEQYRQNNPHFARPENDMQGGRDESFDEGEEDAQPSMTAMGESPYGTREPQPYIPPNAQPFVPRDTPQPYQPRDQRDAQPQEARPQPRAPQPQPQSQPDSGNVDALPAFITGGAPQPAQPNGQNGYENGGQPDRFPLHRRRRRHRGPRDGTPQGGEGPNDAGGA